MHTCLSGKGGIGLGTRLVHAIGKEAQFHSKTPGLTSSPMQGKREKKRGKGKERKASCIVTVIINQFSAYYAYMHALAILAIIPIYWYNR